MKKTFYLFKIFGKYTVKFIFICYNTNEYRGGDKVSFIGNLIWLVFGGIFSFIGWFLAGIILSITIIGIPFGIQCFKISRLVLWPFGTEVEVGSFGFGGLIGNILWILLLGWELCIFHIIVGILFSITIIGIPFGKQHFKFALLALLPFGAKIK